MTPYYEADGITIYHGDCRDVIGGLGYDCVITDPPYGIAHRSHGQLFKKAERIPGDESLSLALWLIGHVIHRPLVMFFSPYTPVGDWRNILVWSKGQHVGIGGDRETCWKRDFELIGVRDNKPLNGKRDSAVLHYHALLPPPSGHFAEKPVDLLQYLIFKLSSIGDCVLDPFMGSGTTLVAAKNLGRKAIGIEIEEKYCEIAARRLDQGVLDLGAAFHAISRKERRPNG